MNGVEKEREMIRAAAAKTAEKIVLPRAAVIDATGEIPWDLVETFSKQGFLSLLLPEEYGGTNGDLTSFCSVVEEIAKVSGSASLLILAQGIGMLPILIGGSPFQKDKYFTQIAQENHLIAYTLSEPEWKWDATSIKTRGEKKEGDYLLNGRKDFITNGSISHLYSAFVVTDPDREVEGISAFVVEKGTPGLSFGKREEKLGMKGLVTTDVIFQNCRVPEANRIGEEGEGWKIAMGTSHRSNPAVGALAVGIAQGALDYAIRYANERIQFGKPIASFQGIRFLIADMATQVEAARALVYKAVNQLDAQPEESKKISAIAKCFASEVAMKVTTDAVQILGGYGYMRDYPVERMMRDAKVTQIYEGPNQIQRLWIAHQLIKS